MIDWTKPLVDEYDRPARLIATDLNRRDGLTHVVAVMQADGNEGTLIVNSEGHHLPFFTLHNVPKRTSRFVNIYPKQGLGQWWSTRLAAEDSASPTRVAVLELICEDDVPIDAIIHKI